MLGGGGLFITSIIPQIRPRTTFYARLWTICRYCFGGHQIQISACWFQNKPVVFRRLSQTRKHRFNKRFSKQFKWSALWCKSRLSPLFVLVWHVVQKSYLCFTSFRVKRLPHSCQGGRVDWRASISPPQLVYATSFFFFFFNFSRLIFLKVWNVRIRKVCSERQRESETTVIILLQRVCRGGELSCPITRWTIG